jgi:hypothetical protein
MKMQLVALPQFIIGLILYSIHFILVRLVPEYNFTIIRCYAADILVLIVCIPIFINSQIFFRIRKKKYITKLDVFVYFILFSLYFEIVMPNYFTKFTSDLFDIIAYGLGGTMLYFSQELNKRKYNAIVEVV